LVLEKIIPFDISLFGFQSVEIFKKYQRFSGIISIEGENIKAIFSVSKNNIQRIGSISRIVSSSIDGLSNFNIVWNPNDTIHINKTVNEYDGVYTVKIVGI